MPYDEQAFNFLKAPESERLFSIGRLASGAVEALCAPRAGAANHQVMINAFPLSRFSGLLAVAVNERRNQVCAHFARPCDRHRVRSRRRSCGRTVWRLDWPLRAPSPALHCGYECIFHPRSYAYTH